jgi:uncharacterized metal-binding protein
VGSFIIIIIIVVVVIIIIIIIIIIVVVVVVVFYDTLRSFIRPSAGRRYQHVKEKRVFVLFGLPMCDWHHRMLLPEVHCCVALCSRRRLESVNTARSCGPERK